MTRVLMRMNPYNLTHPHPYPPRPLFSKSIFSKPRPSYSCSRKSFNILACIDPYLLLLTACSMHNILPFFPQSNPFCTLWMGWISQSITLIIHSLPQKCPLAPKSLQSKVQSPGDLHPWPQAHLTSLSTAAFTQFMRQLN